jgi:hypothetical protein
MAIRVVLSGVCENGGTAIEGGEVPGLRGNFKVSGTAGRGGGYEEGEEEEEEDHLDPVILGSRGGGGG